jgi:pyridoxamine 5'-phosphate oxidase family protein
MAFTEAELDYLRTQPLARLATIQPDGTPQVSPVGFSFNAELGTIDIGGFTMSTSQKYRNVLSNDKVALVVDDLPSTDPWRVRCLEIRGTAQAVPRSPACPEGSDDALIRITPKRILSFGVIHLDQPPHEMTVSKRNVPAGRSERPGVRPA